MISRPEGAGVENTNPAGLDQVDSIVLGALIEQGLAAIENFAATVPENGLALA